MPARVMPFMTFMPWHSSIMDGDTIETIAMKSSYGIQDVYDIDHVALLHSAKFASSRS